MRNSSFKSKRDEGSYAHNKARPQHREPPALLFLNSAMKSCKTGPTVLSSLSEKTRKSNHLQM